MTENIKIQRAPKRITIEEADNGYIFSISDSKGEKRMVCKTMDDVIEKVKGAIGKTKKEVDKSEGSYRER